MLIKEWILIIENIKKGLLWEEKELYQNTGIYQEKQ